MDYSSSAGCRNRELWRPWAVEAQTQMVIRLFGYIALVWLVCAGPVSAQPGPSAGSLRTFNYPSFIGQPLLLDEADAPVCPVAAYRIEPPPEQAPPAVGMSSVLALNADQSNWSSAGPPAAYTDDGGSAACTVCAPSYLQPAASGWRKWLGGGAVCDDCPTHGIVALVGYDSWRGVTDDSWQNNGIHAGLNYGTRLGRFSDLTGIGFQVGGTAGAYDWAGTDYRPTDTNTAETQGFLTYGFFRRANERSKWSAALVQDWMFNDNYGVFSQNPTLSQFRGQIGYAFNAWNEIGVWGTWRCVTDTRDVNGVGPTTWRAVNQLNTFWHHKWQAFGPDTWLWVGVPEGDRLAGGGSLGDYVVGTSASLPLNNVIAVYTVLTYMHQSARPSPTASEEEAWNFTIGLSFYPGRNARSSTVAGRCWMPMMPVANNGYFMVDTNHH